MKTVSQRLNENYDQTYIQGFMRHKLTKELTVLNDKEPPWN